MCQFLYFNLFLKQTQGFRIPNYNKSSTSNDGIWHVYKRPSFFPFERKGAKGWRRGRHEDEIFLRIRCSRICILYGSFMFSSNAQWFKLSCLQFVPQVPNKSTLYPICFAQSHPLVNYIASLKENTRLCPFWDWQKLHHSTTLTWLCHVKRFYFRSEQKSVFFLWGGGHSKSPSPIERKSLDHFHTTQLCPAQTNEF